MSGVVTICRALTLLGNIAAPDPADKDPKNKTKEDFDNLPRPSLMSMLVHWTYFRDLNVGEVVAAKVLGYSNRRAKNYGGDHWEPYYRKEDESELKELGLAFLLRKHSHKNGNAPVLAILLRGTIPTKPKDILADLRIGAQELNKSKRVLRTVEWIVEVVEGYLRENPKGQEDICLAGHSLGAAIALIVGGTLYSTYGIHIDTHLFNPPLVTVVDVFTGRALLDHLDGAVANLEVNFAALKQVFVEAFGDKQALADEWEQFARLEKWVPQFYLNPGDPVCRLYIDFYMSQQGQTLEAAKDLVSYQGLLSSLFNPKAKYFKDVVPSADLHISHWKEEDLRLAHSLRQWHKYTPEYIELEKVHEARLLRQRRSIIRNHYKQPCRPSHFQNVQLGA